MQKIKAKVCIVGSGVAGSLCAKFLAQKVDDILIVERGTQTKHAWRVQTHRQEQQVPTSIHHHVVTSGRQEEFQYVYALGGTTNQWTGQAPRMLPNDFRMKSVYGIMEDWPIGYDELEPFYCIAEEELGVAGGSDNPLTPRSKPYPLPPHSFSPADLLMKKCFPPQAIVSCAQARPSRDIGNRPACCGSATCAICPVDSKYTTLNTHIPQLKNLSSVRFQTETVVISLEASGRKIARAIAKSAGGEDVQIEAEQFILAANGLENPAILLRSPGLPQQSAVGKYLFDHPVFIVSVLTSQEGFPYHGNSYFTAHCYHFYDGGFRNQRAGALGDVMNIAGLTVSDVATSIATERGSYGTDLRRQTTEQFRRQVGLAFLLDDLPNPQRMIRIGAKRNHLGIQVTEISNPPSSTYLQRTKDHIVAEVPKLLSQLGPKKVISRMRQDAGAGHLLGTCRMGDFRSGVVDPFLRYHPMDNLYILGGSAFPTYSPANPTLTIAALAIRLGMHLT